MEIFSKKYHPNPAINIKIVALFKWFNLERKKIPLPKQLTLLNRWVKILLQQEEYEIAEAFLNYMKPLVLKRIRIKRRLNRPFLQKILIFKRIYIMKIKTLFK